MFHCFFLLYATYFMSLVPMKSLIKCCTIFFCITPASVLKLISKMFLNHLVYRLGGSSITTSFNHLGKDGGVGSVVTTQTERMNCWVRDARACHALFLLATTFCNVPTNATEIIAHQSWDWEFWVCRLWCLITLITCTKFCNDIGVQDISVINHQVRFPQHDSRILSCPDLA